VYKCTFSDSNSTPAGDGQTLNDAYDSVDFELLGNGHHGLVVTATPHRRHTLVVRPHTQPDVGHRLRSYKTEMTYDRQKEQPETARLDVRPDHLPSNLFTNIQTIFPLL